MNVWVVMNGYDYEGEDLAGVGGSFDSAKAVADQVPGKWGEWIRSSPQTVRRDKRSNSGVMPDYQEIRREKVQS